MEAERRKEAKKTGGKPGEKPKVWGYLRVSTIDQDLKKFRHDILELANVKKLGTVQFVEEKISGKVSWKERLIAQIIGESKQGDSIIVPELSRLGRSMLDIMEILAIAVEKGIKVYAIKGNWQLDGSLQSKLVAMCFSMAAEIEWGLNSQRIKEALADRKAKGVKLGRRKGSGKSKLDIYKEEIQALFWAGSKQKYIAAKYKTTEANLIKWCRKHSIDKKPRLNGD